MSLTLQELQNKTDAEILVIAIESPSVFKVLVDRYQKDFLRKIQSMLRNREEAEDIVQDTFVKIYVNAKKYRVEHGATFKSWAYKILLNTCYTHLKKRKREREIYEFQDPDILELAAAESGEEKRLDLDEFMSIVSKVPVMLGRMLTLQVLDGKTNEDIARIEEVSEGTVRTRLHRAKQEFRKANHSI